MHRMFLKQIPNNFYFLIFFKDGLIKEASKQTKEIHKIQKITKVIICSLECQATAERAGLFTFASGDATWRVTAGDFDGHIQCETGEYSQDLIF